MKIDNISQVYFNGEKVDGIESVEFEMSEDFAINKNSSSMQSIKYEAVISSGNTIMSQEAIEEILLQKPKYLISGMYMNLPRGNRLPKKKRMRNKWIKKYSEEIVIEDVELVKSKHNRNHR